MQISLYVTCGCPCVVFAMPWPKAWMEVCQYSLSQRVVNYKETIWAASWQNQQSDYAPSEDSDQPGRPPSLRVRAQWVAKDPSFLHVDSEDWSDWADAQADLSLRWAHSHIVGFVMSRLILLLNEYRNGGNIHTDLYHIFSLGVNTNHPFHSSANTKLSHLLGIEGKW